MTKQTKRNLLELMDSILQLLNLSGDLGKRKDFFKEIIDGIKMIQTYIMEEHNSNVLLMLYEIENELEQSIDYNEPFEYKKLLEIKNQIEKIDTKTKIVFFPYKVQMWGVFHTIYEAALADPYCEVSVVPIPYYTKKNSGERQFCYEGDFFKDKVKIISYLDYKIEKERPDIVYVHNIYDNYNTITEVEETYFTNNLKQFARKLVYVPYFVSSFCIHAPEEKEFWFDLPGLQNVDKIILAGAYLENTAMMHGIAQEKILPLGSPKLDTIVQALKETIELPKEWENRLGNRKVIFVNTLYHVFEYWDVIQKILTLPKENNNLAVIWRPHPLTEAFLDKHTPQYLSSYQEVKEIIRQGIDCPYVVLDEEKDYIYALKRADLMVSSVSSLLNSFLFTKKPVIFLGDFPASSVLPKETFEFFPDNLEELEKFIVEVLEEQDECKIHLRDQAYRIYANADGTCGKTVHQSLMKEIQLEDDREDVLSVFEKGDYKKAFFMWKNIYNESKDLEEKKTIYQLLKDIYYIPNQQEVQRVYYENYSLISQYPFIFGWNSKKWEDLDVEIFPLSEEEFCFFHKGKDRFYGSYINRTDQIPYFFTDLDKPLFLEEVFLQSYLQYLQDNVRKSEDYGGDNHIYLYYDDADMLSIILQWGNLSSILQDEKFIFLIGREQKNRYPIDFKEQFGIEYFAENKKPIQLDEINRVCYWYKHPYSGNDFGRELLGISPYIQELKGQDFHIYSMKHNKILWESDSFRSIIKNPKQTLSFAQLKSFNPENGYELYFKEYDIFLEWLENRVEKEEVSVIELFKGYFLYRYEKRMENPRIAPMLLWDLHMTENNVYEEIVKEFPYKIVLTAMRNPIVVLARAYEFGLIGWNEFQTKYFLASTYLHGQFLSEELDSIHFAYCFENLKMYPREQLKALCKLLNVPFDESMLEAKIPMVHNNGEVVEGFDLKPLKRKLDQQLSDFDQMRLKIYYEPILKYYGYDTFDLEEYPLPMNEVAQLFHYPFRFERENQEKFGEFAPSPEELRKWIYDVMIQTYNDYRIGKKIRFPKLVQLDWEVE